MHGGKIGRDGERPFIALDRFGMAPERGNRVAEIGVRRRKPRVDFDGLAEFRRRFRVIASLGARDAAVDMGGRPLDRFAILHRASLAHRGPAAIASGIGEQNTGGGENRGCPLLHEVAPR